MSAPSFAALQSEYARLWHSMTINSSAQHELAAARAVRWSIPAWIVLTLICAMAFVWFMLALPGHLAARDLGQWGGQVASERRWFQELMRPDMPQAPCCGEADAYWADAFEVEGDHYVAIITDERDDEPLHRPHLDAGTRIVVPNEKIKWDQGNPTGHGVLFFGTASHTIYCYVPPGGV